MNIRPLGNNLYAGAGTPEGQVDLPTNHLFIDETANITYLKTTRAGVKTGWVRADGPKGEKGDSVKGDTGPAGPAGVGSVGPAGPQGIQGEPGEDGGGSGSGYALTLFSDTPVDPADEDVKYIGFGNRFSVNDFDLVRVEIPKDGVIKRFSVKIFCTAGGSVVPVEHFIAINNGVTLAGNISMVYNAATVEGVDSTISQAVVAGDFIALKFEFPLFAGINPTNVTAYCVVYVD